VALRVKRVYEEPEEVDGERILVDRLWPRGLSKEKARIDLWRKDLAPSDELRRRFGHHLDRWEGFSAQLVGMRSGSSHKPAMSGYSWSRAKRTWLRTRG
jgi:uncharacterized protein YeaO (DUF488 family)